MKYLIASDIHGSAYWAERLMEAIHREQPERIILLGDLLYHGPRNDLPRDYAPKRVIEMLNGLAAHGNLVAVRGNCEAEVDQMVLDFPCMADYAVVIDDRGRTLHCTHGHLSSPDDLPSLPLGAAFLSGHTHVKLHEKRVCPFGAHIECFNPGSVSIPKDGSHSYGIYEDGAFRHVVLTEE